MNESNAMLRIIFLSFFLVGCATVKITDRDGSVTVERGFGTVNVITNVKEGAVYADLSLIGYATTPFGQVIGFSKQSIALMSESCKLILWLDSSTSESVVEDFLIENDSICILNFNKREGQ